MRNKRSLLITAALAMLTLLLAPGLALIMLDARPAHAQTTDTPLPPAATDTPGPADTVTPGATATLTPTAAITATVTPTGTVLATETPTTTVTPTLTMTATVTPTLTITATASVTAAVPETSTPPPPASTEAPAATIQPTPAGTPTPTATPEPPLIEIQPRVVARSILSRVLSAGVVLLFGLLLSWLAHRLTLRLLLRVAPEVRVFSAQLIRIAVIIGTILWALSTLQVYVATVATILGTVGLALSLSSQDLAKNVIAGIYLIMERPFQVGDEISLGAYTGIVEVIDLRTTRMRTTDGLQVIVPNTLIMSQVVTKRMEGKVEGKVEAENENEDVKPKT